MNDPKWPELGGQKNGWIDSASIDNHADIIKLFIQ